MQKRNRKGFTLAELLIVVAIIAVLVAIAVPLFVGALNDAEENVKSANIRAVRSVACYEILENQEKYFDDDTYKSTGAYAWYAYAKVTADGEVTSLTIEKDQKTVKSKAGSTNAKLDLESDSKTGDAEKVGSEYEILIKLTETNLKTS